jgi:hypothetical protein
MNSSSRAIATARAKRAGENNPPPVNGNRPGTRPNTSIHSANVFNPNQSQPRLPPRGPIQMPNNFGQPGPNQYGQPGFMSNQYGQMQMPNMPNNYGQPGPNQYDQPMQQNALPFTKLSTSDAIGLITLRLGSVEKFIIDLEHEKNIKNDEAIDHSLITTLLNRIELLEKREPIQQIVSNNESNDAFKESLEKSIQEVIKKQEEAFKHIDEEFTKTKTTTTKHTEDLFKLKREVIEIGDAFKTFKNMYDYFVKDTGEKFADYELALTEIENKIQYSVSEDVPSNSIKSTSEYPNNVEENITYSLEDLLPSTNNSLKTLVEKELSSIDI